MESANRMLDTTTLEDELIRVSDIMTDEECNKNFKALLKKYQDLVLDYYHQDKMNKNLVNNLIDKLDRVTIENKKLQKENERLSERLKALSAKLGPMGCRLADLFGIKSKRANATECEDGFCERVVYPNDNHI